MNVTNELGLLVVVRVVPRGMAGELVMGQQNVIYMVHNQYSGQGSPGLVNGAMNK